MKRILLALIAIAFYTSCTKDRYTVLDARLYNNTNYHIIILPYKNGSVMASDTIYLNPNDSMQFGLSTDLGDITGPGFYSDYFGESDDSIVVIFDGIYKITHYGNLPSILAAHYYLNNSNRNLGNPLSYEFSRIKDKKDVFTNLHKYRFSEQDYLDAKE